MHSGPQSAAYESDLLRQFPQMPATSAHSGPVNVS